MAYERPTQWTHGDIPTAAYLNHYSNSLGYLVPFFVSRQFHTKASNSADGTWFALTKKYRWLHYIVASSKSDGEIEDPGGVQDNVVLSKGDGGWNVLDLDTITWLTPGKLYLVKDVKVALESKITATASSIV